MVKIKLKLLGKIILSGIIAFTVLTLFSYFYYNIPVHSASEDGSTDYKWKANAFYSRCNEGFASGKTNNDGFTNSFDYDEDMKIDVLIMGSSHMEAYQVDMSESAASRLNALLENDTVYNIGVSGHNFLTCAGNLEAALNKYHPTKYVVIETSSISFSNKAIRRAINGKTAEISPNNEGFIGFLQQNPYLRLIYKQIKNYTSLQAQNAQEAETAQIPVASDNSKNAKLMGRLLKKMSSWADKCNTKIIILYHPAISLTADGNIIAQTDADLTAQFQSLCDDNGIFFLDMSDRFIKEYEDGFILPYGFPNSPVGSGHLNKYGHAMIAEELYNLISEVEL